MAEHSKSWCDLVEKLKKKGHSNDSASAIATQTLAESVELSEDQSDKLASLLETLPTQEAALAAWTELYEAKDGKWLARVRAKSEGVSFMAEMGRVESITEEKDGLPSKARVVLMSAGDTATKGRNYPAASLKALVESGLLDGVKMYDAHPAGSEVIPGAAQKPRTIRDYLSYVIPGTVEWNESLQAVTAVVKLVDKDFREKLKDVADTIGISLNHISEAVMRGGKEVITKFRRIVSADWVPEANAGGRVLGFAESVSILAAQAETGRKEEGTMPVLNEWTDLTPEMLKEHCPGIVEGIESQIKEKQTAAEKIAADAKRDAEAKAAGETAAKAEAKSSADKLAANEKAMAEQTTVWGEAALLKKAIEYAEAQSINLNALGKAAVMSAAIGKKFSTEKEMTEAIDGAVKNIPQPKRQEQEKQPEGKTQGMPQASKEFAEKLGYTAEEIKRLETAQ